MRSAASVASRMEMHADLDTDDACEHCSHDLCDPLRGREPYGIGERNLPHARSDEPVVGPLQSPGAPRLAIGIPEGHRDICDCICARVASASGNRLKGRERLLSASGADCGEETRARWNTEIRECCTAPVAMARSAPFSLTTMPMISTSVSGLEQFEHLLGVGHLRDCRGRDEADRVDVREARGDQACADRRPSRRAESAPAVPARHRVGTRRS